MHAERSSASPGAARIESARRRATFAKRVLAATAAVGFVAVVPLMRGSAHAASGTVQPASSAASQTSGSTLFGQGQVAPAAGSSDQASQGAYVPQAQTSVS
jgi:hypothetical protein